LVAAGLVFLLRGRPPRARAVIALLPLLALLASAIGVVGQWSAPGHDRSVDADDVASLVPCDMAQVIARDAGQRPAIVLASPDATVHLAWFGRLRGVGTLYWENRAGLPAGGGLFNPAPPTRARTLS